MSSQHIFRVFFTLIICNFLPLFTYSQNAVCHIPNQEQFLKKVHASGSKTIEVQISGLSDQKAIDKFIQDASGADHVVSVKIGNSTAEKRDVTVRLDEMGGLNTFRLMLMSASVKTIKTQGKTYEVLRLAVKKENPFE